MSTNLKNTFLFATLVSLCFLIKCKSDTGNEVALLQETSKPITVSEDQHIDNTKFNTPSEEGIVQNNDSPSKIESDVKEKISTEIKNKKENTILKKEVPKKKVVKFAPKIEFEETTWNFGEIVEGDIIKKKFKFTNTGKAPLQIIGADASCGCARPTVPFLDIAPGESNEIGITYNSVNKKGDQKPEIIIESNTYPKHTVLKLFGTVKLKQKEEKKIDLDTATTKQDTTSNS
ncbi:MAG: hypothetical protein ACJA1A_003772 [Saprospiraceae bacterium]|jgi:hypothetical protein